ncbi:hypothetical protein AJ78_04065 [Emergomyces pasteurianus Ep9510]|uniref:Fungal-type protein kinase domain-containing protein n=1 Tax=Emergomyces pasteurianus Ep9510 TaxID=1447872 RepID=A0A1J9PGZ1_9EURO|nr:hypothetical protein AJ78_04065 [Emergomyces pasteurianus Ep9510]
MQHVTAGFVRSSALGRYKALRLHEISEQSSSRSSSPVLFLRNVERCQFILLLYHWQIFGILLPMAFNQILARKAVGTIVKNGAKITRKQIIHLCEDRSFNVASRSLQRRHVAVLRKRPKETGPLSYAFQQILWLRQGGTLISADSRDENRSKKAVIRDSLAGIMKEMTKFHHTPSSLDNTGSIVSIGVSINKASNISEWPIPLVSNSLADEWQWRNKAGAGLGFDFFPLPGTPRKRRRNVQLAEAHNLALNINQKPLAQPSRPLDGSIAARKLNIGFVDDLEATEDSRCGWSQILILGELKNDRNDGPSSAWLDLRRYAREALAAQDSRHSVLGFTLWAIPATVGI